MALDDDDDEVEWRRTQKWAKANKLIELNVRQRHERVIRELANATTTTGTRPIDDQDDDDDRS